LFTINNLIFHKNLARIDFRQKSMIEFDIPNYRRIDSKLYEKEKRKLLIELVKLQDWIIQEKKKIAVVFEGRDTAGKTGSISVLSKYLIPKHCRLVKLGIPTENESKNWFQRYEKLMPETGELVFFDRSWYTRALVEATMGYCTERQYKSFMKKVIPWEERFMENDTKILKFYLSIEKGTQKMRIEKRKNSPLVYWKISENDLKGLDRWDIFTLYKEQMFKKTSHPEAPWIVLNANDKKIAVLHALRYILGTFDYPNKDLPKPKIWTENINDYSLTINKVPFNNLSYQQYKVLKVLADEE
jgi:polyphosphate kinase 2